MSNLIVSLLTMKVIYILEADKVKTLICLGFQLTSQSKNEQEKRRREIQRSKVEKDSPQCVQHRMLFTSVVPACNWRHHPRQQLAFSKFLFLNLVDITWACLCSLFINLLVLPILMFYLFLYHKSYHKLCFFNKCIINLYWTSCYVWTSIEDQRWQAMSISIPQPPTSIPLTDPNPPNPPPVSSHFCDVQSSSLFEMCVYTYSAIGLTNGRGLTLSHVQWVTTAIAAAEWHAWGLYSSDGFHLVMYA